VVPFSKQNLKPYKSGKRKQGNKLINLKMLYTSSVYHSKSVFMSVHRICQVKHTGPRKSTWYKMKMPRALSELGV